MPSGVRRGRRPRPEELPRRLRKAPQSIPELRASLERAARRRAAARLLRAGRPDARDLRGRALHAARPARLAPRERRSRRGAAPACRPGARLSLSSSMASTPTFYTVADARFFPGVVALLNSLRLSGNEGELVVLDRGLARSQRERLEQHANVVDLRDEARHAAFAKPFPRFLEVKGVIVLVDSDVLIVSGLDHVLPPAAAGKICVFPE